MTARELIAELEQHDMDLEVCIDNVSLEMDAIREVKTIETAKQKWFENKFVGYEKVEVIVLWR